MTARMESGWLVVDCDAPDTAAVHIAVGAEPGDDDWQPAYRDGDDDARVAKIRPPATTGRQPVWLRVDGVVSAAGRI